MTIFKYFLTFRVTVKPPVSDPPKCEDSAVAYGRWTLACVASFSVPFQSKEQEREPKSQRLHEKWGGSNIRPRPKIPVLVVPRSFFAPKPHGNACYAAYTGSLTGSSRESTHRGSFLVYPQTHLRFEIEFITPSF